jgi:2-methylcitrate dehydratase
MTIAGDIAKYSSSIEFEAIPERTVNSAKRLLIDSLGCAIGACKETPIQIAIKASGETKYGSTILTTKQKTFPGLAAFVNGAMVRYFDYNDTYLSKEPAHPSDNIFPVLAVAEAEGLGGKDAVLGIVLAYELQCRLCDAANLWKRGWDHVNYGLVSVSAASSRLMRLPSDKTAHAINIALNSHIAMRQVRAGELSMWKALSFCNAARNAVFAAMLAKHGMTGPAPIFEGEMGFWKQVSGPFQLDVSTFGGNGNPFRIDEAIIKYFPAEIHSQTAIWAALEARKEISGIGEIEKVEIGSHEAGFRIIGKDAEKWDPQTRETADHSIPYIVAAALMDGKISDETFKKKRFRDPRTLAFLKKISVTENPELTSLYPKAIPNELKITLKGGRVIRKRVIYPKGHPQNMLSEEEIEEKFRMLAGRYLDKKKMQGILDCVRGLEKLPDIGKLMKLCVLR